MSTSASLPIQHLLGERDGGRIFLTTFTATCNGASFDSKCAAEGSEMYKVCLRQCWQKKTKTRLLHHHVEYAHFSVFKNSINYTQPVLFISNSQSFVCWKKKKKKILQGYLDWKLLRSRIIVPEGLVIFQHVWDELRTCPQEESSLFRLTESATSCQGAKKITLFFHTIIHSTQLIIGTLSGMWKFSCW